MSEENFIKYIYTLSCPKTGDVRYVGATQLDPRRRLNVHIYDAKKKNECACQNWINSLLVDGLSPKMDVIEVTNASNWAEREIFWIAYYKEIGGNLTNYVEGGGNHSHRPKKPVIQYSLTGEFIQKWESVRKAGRELKIDSTGSRISKCCMGRKTSLGGCIWRYADNPLPEQNKYQIEDEEK
jgi:hypothetical protein